MRLVPALLCLAALQAQERPAPPPVAAPTEPVAHDCRLEGQVLAENNSAPLRRARVTLQSLDTGAAAITVETDERGAFAIHDIAAGGYTLRARRDGYLESSQTTRNGLRMPKSFSIASGQAVTGLTFRLRPWGVITGRVRYNDGDPAIDVRIDLYRQVRSRGRVFYNNVASTLTNDQGEYRVHDLTPGEYYVAAAYERTIAQQQPVEEQTPLDAQGKELPVFGYTTTFFPDTVKFSEAVPVKVDAGREIGGIDLFVQQTRKVKVRGRIMNGVAGGAIPATMFITRLDGNDSAAVPLPLQTAYDKNNNFEIKNVPPGVFELWAEATVENKRLVARRTISVANEDVENLDLIAAAGQDWTGEIRVEGEARLPDRYTPRVRLEPRSERGLMIDIPAARSPFALSVMPSEVYDVVIPNLPEDFYISAVRTGGADVRDTGLAGSSATIAPFQIALDSRGGRVSGELFNADGNVLSGANIVLIPQLGRLQDYREALADEYGQFSIRGVAPGTYTLSAWIDDPPCDPYNPQALDGCRAHGVSLTVTASSDTTSAFTIR